MPEYEFTELFPEWALSWSLSEVCKEKPKFWDWSIVHPTNEPDLAKKFSDLFNLIESPVLHFERPFTKEEWKVFKISDEYYKKTFWSLRPDFIIKDNKQSLVLLEAKGGKIQEKVWTHPKECSYFQFLKDCKVPLQKGFYYIIPRTYTEKCKNCLNKYFTPEDNIQTGFIYWEDLLPIINQRLTEMILDRLIDEIQGLKELRQWQKDSPKMGRGTNNKSQMVPSLEI
jgi:hypothetical protein